jgi:hypothetical protein
MGLARSGVGAVRRLTLLSLHLLAPPVRLTARLSTAAEGAIELVEAVLAQPAQPKGEATTLTSRPEEAPTGALAEPPVTPVDLAAAVAQLPAEEAPGHDELPIPDFDHLTVGSLRSRLRGLDRPQLQTLLDFERAHARRLPVLTLLESRIAALQPAEVEGEGQLSAT